MLYANCEQKLTLSRLLLSNVNLESIKVFELEKEEGGSVCCLRGWRVKLRFTWSISSL